MMVLMNNSALETPFLSSLSGKTEPICALCRASSCANNAPPQNPLEPETLIVVSSDLSHYHDYETANTMDWETSRRIESLAAPDIDSEHACGCRPINGLIQAARAHHLRASTLDLRNSGDTAGTRDQVVGYGAYAIA